MLNPSKRHHPALVEWRTWFLFVTTIVFLFACSSCKKADPTGTSPAGSAAPSASSVIAAPNLHDRPPPKSTRRTTSGEIALGNLGAEIRGLERLVEQRKDDLAIRRNLIESLKLRGEMTGRIADVERAVEMAETLAKDMPDKPEAYLARAALRATLHRFDDAWADLDEAERRGSTAGQTRQKRASILFARGKIDDALVLAEQMRKERATIDTLGFQAVLLGELGRKAEALAAFREAFEIYPDTSPFPVAWLFFAQGQFWEREGNTDLAIAYHRACLERLPAHAHAAAHWARMASPEEAEAIVKPLLDKVDDPELQAVLSAKLEARGAADAAKEHRIEAGARYDELVAKHPEAYVDHAAQFWLDVGGDAPKAFELAKRNLSWRKTARAYELAVVTALAVHDKQAACTLGTEGVGQGRATSMFRAIVNGACGGK